MKSLGRAYLWTSFLSRPMLVLILIVLLSIPTVTQPSSVVIAVSFQRTRVEVMAKDAILLQYLAPSDPAASQALSDIQTTLPVWKQEEAQMQAIPDSAVQLAASAANGDYLQLSAAFGAITALPGRSASPTEVTIIRMHDRPYLTAITQVVTVLNAEIAAQQDQALFVAIGAFVVFLVLSIIDIPVALSDRRREVREKTRPPPGNA